MIVLGIDPGYAHLGIAVARFTASRTEALLVETVRTTTKLTALERVRKISLHVLGVLGDPDFDELSAVGFESQAGVEAGKMRAAMENPEKLQSNAASRRVHEVVGVIQCAAAARRLPIYEHAPSTLKCSLLGKGGGRASKAQMRLMAGRIFGMPGLPEHSADALAACVATANKHRRALAEKRAGLRLIS